MGPWLVAQCDPYQPAAQAAKTAFMVAFPPAKQAQALSFCKTEVFKVLNFILEIFYTKNFSKMLPHIEVK